MIVLESAGVEVRVWGPLADHAERFIAELVRQGFRETSRTNQLRLMAHLSRWMDAKGLELAEVSAADIEAFLDERRRTHTGLFSRKALRVLLDWLAVEDLIPVSAAATPVVVDPLVVTRFAEYLRAERRLTEGTIAGHVSRVRRFVAGYVPEGDMNAVSAAVISRALLDEGVTRKPVAVKRFGYTLRALLRFCFVSGEMGADLTSATMVIRSPQPSRLPVGVDAADIDRLLGACDRGTALGRREYAVIVLLVRLGLRAGEVARLRLEDIDWGRGEVLIRGKGNRDERLPLPHDAGEAVVAYLQHSRPADTGLREVFLTWRAPARPLTRASIGWLLRRACDRAGLPVIGPHRLRHTLGEQMVTAGVSFPAIGQVLRHSDPLTTAGYARVNLPMLRALSQPWPGAMGGER